MARRLVAVTGLFFLTGFLGGCQGLVKGVSQLTVNVDGAGSGTITSSPAGINCPGTCSANFTGNPQVTLTDTCTRLIFCGMDRFRLNFVWNADDLHGLLF